MKNQIMWQSVGAFCIVIFAWLAPVLAFAASFRLIRVTNLAAWQPTINAWLLATALRWSSLVLLSVLEAHIESQGQVLFSFLWLLFFPEGMIAAVFGSKASNFGQLVWPALPVAAVFGAMVVCLRKWWLEASPPRGTV
jgi:hypothetical protein